MINEFEDPKRQRVKGHNETVSRREKKRPKRK